MNRAKWLTIVFVVVLGGMTVWNLCSPKREYSETENRYLQQFPSFSWDALFSGEFGQQFKDYAADQFPQRDAWVAIKSITQLALLQKDNGRVYYGEDGRLFAVPAAQDAAREERNCQAVADFLRWMKEAYPETSCSVLLSPTASTILPEELPANAPVADEAALIEQLRQAVGDAAVFVDPTDALRAVQGNAFYKTDHHWTTAGAYAAYCAWAQATGVTALPKEAFSIETVSTEFYGTLYSKAGLPWLRPDTMEAWRTGTQAGCRVSQDGGKTWTQGLYFADYLSQRDQYSYFLGGNQPLTIVETGVKNGKTLLVIKDSYAHSFTPFLTEHYERILLLDPRYFRENLRDWVGEQGITDVLVLYNAATFAEDQRLAPLLTAPGKS